MEQKLPDLTIGRIVHYKLSASDAESVNETRKKARDGDYSRAPGNDAAEGHVCPAMVVRTWTDDPSVPAAHQASVQLQVFLDGADVLWVTSRTHRGPDEWTVGTFAWPTVNYAATEAAE